MKNSLVRELESITQEEPPQPDDFTWFDFPCSRDEVKDVLRAVNLVVELAAERENGPRILELVRKAEELSGRL